MVLKSDFMKQEEPIQESGPGRVGGLLSSRKSRALLDKVLEAVDVERTKVPVAKQEQAVHEIELVLKEAQGKKAATVQGFVIDAGDSLVGKQCAACKGALAKGDLVVKAKDLTVIHARCANE